MSPLPPLGPGTCLAVGLKLTPCSALIPSGEISKILNRSFCQMIAIQVLSGLRAGWNSLGTPLIWTGQSPQSQLWVFTVIPHRAWSFSLDWPDAASSDTTGRSWPASHPYPYLGPSPWPAKGAWALRGHLCAGAGGSLRLCPGSLPLRPGTRPSVSLKLTPLVSPPSLALGPSEGI